MKLIVFTYEGLLESIPMIPVNIPIANSYSTCKQPGKQFGNWKPTRNQSCQVLVVKEGGISYNYTQ